MPRQEYYLPTRRLVSQDDAAIIQRPSVPRSRFQGSWTRKTTFDAGVLVPFMLDEVLPGDHLSYNVTAYVRMATPLFPLFDNQRIDTFFFYVPNRIVWANWKQFMGEEDIPGDGIDNHIPPYANSPAGGYLTGSIFDHFGLPTEAVMDAPNVYQHSTLPLRAYNLIFSEWFRDQNLQAKPALPMGDGEDTTPTTKYNLLRRAKSHDYFTSALPWPQKFPSPSVPLGGLAPVLGIGGLTLDTPGAASGNVYESNLGSRSYADYKSFNTAGAAHEVLLEQTAAGYPAVFADLSQATGVAINAFRQAFLVQALLERDARGGTRYVELIRSHFGVTSPDFRLQRPEYVGGGQSALQLTPIAQTAPTDGVPVGALGAAGTSVGSHRASYAATEHGHIIGLISVRSELSYQQGLHKMWNRFTRYDYYWPALAGLGEQAILRQEIYCTGIDAADITVFGYQERWQEYRTRTSEVTGLMRSQTTGTLDAWHLAQWFSAAPTLNDVFIGDTPPMDRVLAAAEEAVGQQYLADILIQRTAVRPIPTFGTPVTFGRF